MAAVEDGIGHADHAGRSTGMVHLLDLRQAREERSDSITDLRQSQVNLRPEPGDRVDREDGLDRVQLKLLEGPEQFLNQFGEGERPAPFAQAISQRCLVGGGRPSLARSDSVSRAKESGSSFGCGM